MAYTGRALRIDARHAIEWPSYALSLGVGGSGALSHSGDLPEQGPHQSAGGLRVAELESLRGYGLDVPVLFGYRSDADVVLVWAGLRAGFERDDVDVSLVEAPDEAIAASAHATRLWAGGLVGFAVGLAPLQIRVELDAAYESVHGRLLTSGGELSARVDGLSLTPAAAISAKF